MKKIIILIGNYCSGKTEIALNLAVRAAERGERTQVIDLDRINDYFRMSDHIRVLGQRGVDLVSPSFVGCGLTQTVMPARVVSAFDGDWDLVVFDVGGDQAGALSLARYHQDFAALEPGLGGPARGLGAHGHPRRAHHRAQAVFGGVPEGRARRALYGRGHAPRTLHAPQPRQLRPRQNLKNAGSPPAPRFSLSRAGFVDREAEILYIL